MQKYTITIMVALLLAVMNACSALQPHELDPAAGSEVSCQKTVAGQKDDPEPNTLAAIHEPQIEAVLSQEDNTAAFLETLIDSMSLEEQVSQMFIRSLNAKVTAPSTELANFIKEGKAGGYILFSDNISTLDGTRALTDAISAFSNITPFICIDEEGGTVSRLGAAGLPQYQKPMTARNIGKTGDKQNAYIAGETIGNMLFAIGVNVDFAPVADVLTNPANKVIGNRSFGADPELVSAMAAAFQAGLRSKGIMSAPKHFPGHGNTTGDSHKTFAIIASSADHLADIEYQPFIRLISEGAEFIMAGHIVAPQVDLDGLPATLSKYFITDILREDFGFKGIICTDAMNMGAITSAYSSAEAAVLAVKAGVDMILMPYDYDDAANGIIKAIAENEIPAERIRESLRRILSTKLKAGLIAL